MDSLAPSPTIHYAGFWRRKAAYGIDVFIVIVLVTIVTLLFHNPAQAQSIEQLREAGLISQQSAQLLSALQGSGNGTMTSSALLEFMSFVMVLALVISSVYNIGFVASHWQATPGKRWLGMRITRVDGGQVGILRSTLRHAATGITMGVLSGLGYLTMAFSKEKAALHDLICGTRVVRTDWKE